MSVLEEFYPGSKTPRREAVVVVDEDTSPLLWDASPIIKTVRGKEMEFFTIGSLAQALNRSIVGVRLWERRGYIPKAPYRLPDHEGGKGKRLYTRAIIEATIDEFEKRGLLDARTNVRWTTKHQDLTIALVERWAALVEEEKK